jgi:hypothetical protein
VRLSPGSFQGRKDAQNFHSRSPAANLNPVTPISSSFLFSKPFCFLKFFPVFSACLLLAHSAQALTATPKYVQSNYADPQSTTSSVAVSNSSAQTAGDLNVVIVGWNDATAKVSSVTDAKGNVYQLAAGPTVLTGSSPISQSIYYAKNILAATAGANSVKSALTPGLLTPTFAHRV